MTENEMKNITNKELNLMADNTADNTADDAVENIKENTETNTKSDTLNAEKRNALNNAGSEIALKVTGLCRSQGHFELKDISFALEKGYIMGLVGRMGSGKSTLLKCILNPGLIKKGSVSYEGKAGFIMEDAPFLPEATLKENMKLYGKLYKDYDEAEFSDRLKRAGLGGHKVYGLLSKGERVRFQFAFAMGHHPGLLLLDEPTSGLDVSFRREFLYMLQETVERNMTSIIIATHIVEDLDRVADYIGTMEDGRMTGFNVK